MRLPRPFYYSTKLPLAGLVALLITQANWWTGDEADTTTCQRLPVAGAQHEE